MWGFRRKSHALLQWMCQYKRYSDDVVDCLRLIYIILVSYELIFAILIQNFFLFLILFILQCRKKLEQRRCKITTFHHHQRIALSSMVQLKLSTARSIQQKHHRYNGEFYRYNKCARRGLSGLMQYCVQQKHDAINNYRSVLFWKYFRTSNALHLFKLHRNRRQHKRKMLLDVQLDFENRTMREACVEFLRVAYASGESCIDNNKLQGNGYMKGTTQLSRSDHVMNAILVKRVFAAWKGCVYNSKCIKEGNYTFRHTLNLSTPSEPPTTIHINHAFPNSSIPLSMLSRAPPRSQLPETLPLPVPIRETKLDTRYLPNNTQLDANNSSSPYAYLSASTSLSRPPYPTSEAMYQRQHYNNNNNNNNNHCTHSTMPTPSAPTTSSADIHSLVTSRAAPRTGCENAYSMLNNTIHLSNESYPTDNASHMNKNTIPHTTEDPYLAEQYSQFVQLVQATDLALCTPEQREWMREAALIFKAQLA